MTDKYRIDSHKLMYHPDRLAEFLRDGDCYPIYIELGPSGSCNHRCTFCGLDFVGYQSRFLDYSMLCERLPEMGRLGVKSMVHSGEGEPLLNKDFEKIVLCGKESGISQALATNAVLLTPHRAKEVVPHCEWIKVSIAGGDSKTYAAVHQCKETDFQVAISNIEESVKLKQSHGYDCTIGMQMLLLPENRQTAPILANIARDLGVDYLVIKPFSQQLASENQQYKQVKYTAEENQALQDELSQYNTDTFSVIYRAATMETWDKGEIVYEKCLALPFWAHIDASGNVWGCGNYLHDDRFCYGNLYDNTFEEIWQGDKRKGHLRLMREEWSTAKCRVNCRMDKVNRYLSDLVNPPGHVNFI